MALARLLFFRLVLPDEEFVLGGGRIFRVRSEYKVAAHMVRGQFIVLGFSSQQRGIVVAFQPHRVELKGFARGIQSGKKSFRLKASSASSL